MKRFLEFKPEPAQNAELLWEFEHESVLAVEMKRAALYLERIEEYLELTAVEQLSSPDMNEVLRVAVDVYNRVSDDDNRYRRLLVAEQLAESVMELVTSTKRPIDQRISDTKSLPAIATLEYRREIVAHDLEPCSDCKTRPRPAVLKKRGQCVLHYLTDKPVSPLFTRWPSGHS